MNGWSANDFFLFFLQLFEYSIEQKQYTDWSRLVQKNGLHRVWLERDTPVTNVTFSHKNPAHIVLHDMYMFCIIDQTLVSQEIHFVIILIYILTTESFGH